MADPAKPPAETPKLTTCTQDRAILPCQPIGDALAGFQGIAPSAPRLLGGIPDGRHSFK
jgi:hypothetical protein